LVFLRQLRHHRAEFFQGQTNGSCARKQRTYLFHLCFTWHSQSSSYNCYNFVEIYAATVTIKQVILALRLAKLTLKYVVRRQLSNLLKYIAFAHSTCQRSCRLRFLGCLVLLSRAFLVVVFPNLYPMPSRPSLTWGKVPNTRDNKVLKSISC